MTFGQSVKTCFGKYATFSGRASRSEFWWFWLFQFILSWTVIVHIISFIPALAVMVRRLHDTGRSAWNILWALVPFIGQLIVILLLLGASQGDNQYGPAPVCNTEE